ncbi:MAG: hypothetical protein ACYCW6_25750 [Candidatus Xenobia bacterium]
MSLTITRSVQPRTTPAPAPAPRPTAPREERSLPRRAVEGIGGLVGGVAGAAASFIPGTLTGGIMGVQQKFDAQETTTCQGVLTALETTAAGAVAGGLLGGLPGLAAGAVGGAVFAALYDGSGGAGIVAKEIHARVSKAVGKNPSTGSAARDNARNFVEGAIVGGAVSVKGGAKAGSQVGEGLIAGTLMGLKGSALTALGHYEPPQTPAPDTEQHGIIGKAVRFVVGLPLAAVGSVAGAAAETTDGLLQGLGMGVDAGRQRNYGAQNVRLEGSLGLHRGLIFVKLAAGGLAAGLALAGGGGAVAGLALGAVSGLIVNKVARKSGADKDILNGIATAVKGSTGEDARHADRPVYDTFRDAVEGAMVGTTAGVIEGARAGWSGGWGLADGLIDGISGLFSGVSHAGGKQH